MERRITEKLLKNFEKSMYEDEKSRATTQKYLHDLRRFADFASGRAINKTLALEYKAELGRTYALTSANSMLAALNTFLRFIGWFDCQVKQFKIQKEIFCSEERELSKKEYLSLVRTAENKNNERLSLLIQTICGYFANSVAVSSLTLICVLP